MAFRYMDGFDSYPVTEVPNRWDAGSTTFSFTSGRFGGQSIQLQGNRDCGRKTFDAQSEWILGFSFYNRSGTGSILQWRNGAGGSVIDDLYFNGTTGLFTVRRGGSTNLGSTTIPALVSTWVHVGFRLVVNGTTGIVQVWISGVLDLNLSGQNTGSTNPDTLQLANNGEGSIFCSLDDLYVLDGTGSAPANAFLGDLRIETLYPNGNGNSSQLVGSDGNSTDNYLLVDETSPNDADYVESSTVGDKDTYAYTDLSSSSGTVYAVQPCVRTWKTDAGVRNVKSVARTSGTEVDGPTIVLSASARYYMDVRETKPGGGAWTISDVNASEFGVKVTA